jgi:putative cell wall-binding protein
MSGDVIVKNARKCLKIITTLSLSICISSAWFVLPAMADTTATTTATVNSSVNTDTSALSQMTLAEIQAAAKPMPDDAVTNSVIGSNNDMELKSQQSIPQDGNIYYISSTFVNPVTANYSNPSTSVTTTYYKFLNTEPGRYPFVTYSSYYWEFKDGVMQSNGITTESVSNETLYKQLTGGLPYIPVTDTYQHKRLATMFDIAGELSSNKLDNVVITTGATFADSLSGTVLASKLKAPILYMNTSDDAKVYDYVNNNLNKGGTVYILGKEGAVSTAIENKFSQSGFTVNRIGGATRYDTSEQINDKLNAAQGTPVIIASGENFPDALSISSIAAAKGYPILLTQDNTLPDQTKDELNKIKPSAIYVIGGTGVISQNTFNALKNYSSGVYRISGADRYETSLNICKTFDFNNSSTMVIATGTDFKDALSGSTVAAKYNAPILLINNDITGVKDYLKSTSYKNLIILGNTDAISSDTENALAK